MNKRLSSASRKVLEQRFPPEDLDVFRDDEADADLDRYVDEYMARVRDLDDGEE